VFGQGLGLMQSLVLALVGHNFNWYEVQLVDAGGTMSTLPLVSLSGWVAEMVG